MTEFVSTENDIFLSNPNPIFVLYQVGTYDLESRKVVNNYVVNLLEKNTAYVGRVIDSFLLEFPGGPNGFRMDQLKSVYDVARLAELVVQAGDRAWSNEKQKRAVEIFLHEIGTQESSSGNKS